jgi:hypothetical protein
MEVTPDYPHDEVSNIGVNHFPDGVFQRCRTIINREKAAERERLRKSKRLRKSPKKIGSYSSSFVLPSEWDGDSVSTPGSGTPNHSIGSIRVEDIPPIADDYDGQWEQAMQASPVRTRYRVVPT